MKQVGRDGFTIIETVLFLALSSFMLFIAVQAIGNRSQKVQFTDGMRALEIFLDRHYDNIRNGTIDNTVNCSRTGFYVDLTGPDVPGDCIFLGYYFEFGDFTSTPPQASSRRQVTAHQMVGVRLENNELEGCIDGGTYELKCVNPAPTGITTEFDIPWGIEIFGGEYNSSFNVTSIAMLRKPDSSSIVPVYILNGADPTNLQNYSKNFLTSVIDGGVRQSVIERGEAHLCFASVDRRSVASINIGESFRQESFELAFEESDDFYPACDHPGGAFSGNL